MTRMLMEVAGELEHVPVNARGLCWRTWPVARLGDFTLEVHAARPLGVDEVRAALDRAGLRVLGSPRVHAEPLQPTLSGGTKVWAR